MRGSHHVTDIPLLLGLQLFGLGSADLIVILVYFMVVLGIGFWAMRRIRTQADYFLAGRRFGKVIQVFASFGQATSADTAVSSTTMVSTNGSAGVWAGLAGGLFYMPLVWFWSMWFRRVRLTTLADIYEERYGSRAMAGFYALTQAIFLVMVGGLGLVALSKTVAAIAVKPESALSSSQHEEYERSRELQSLESADYALLTSAQQARLETLQQQNPRREFSYVNTTLFSAAMALIVLIYAGLGGLEGAFLTDLLQGIFLLILSVLLLPFAAARINQLFGTTGVMGPFHAMHRELPEAFFELWGSPGVPEFTWYWIAAYSLVAVFNVGVQANGMVGPASAKDDYTARYGFVVGLFMKRYAMVLWGFLAMMTLLLYGTTTKDPDLVWGLATRDLLGRAGPGLVGLMVACLMAALMSTMSAHQVCVSAMLTRNIYEPLASWMRPNPTATPRAFSDHQMIWIGRLFGILYVTGSVLVAITSDSIFGLMKIIIMFNAIVAASFWMGMVWRRANRYGAWTSMIVTCLMTLVLPILIPLIPNLRSNSYLLKRTEQPPIVRVYTARPADVTERSKLISQWDAQSRRGQTTGPRPQALEPGQKFEKQVKNPSKSVFWTDDIQWINGQPVGQGMLKVELVLLDLLGWDLSKNSYSLDETIMMLLRIVVPFGSLMLVSLFTSAENPQRLDRFYVKMKTRVNADPHIDAQEMAQSYANPHRFDDRKLLPGTSWEFRKWTSEDLNGVIGSCIAAGACVLLLWLMVRMGG